MLGSEGFPYREFEERAGEWGCPLLAVNDGETQEKGGLILLKLLLLLLLLLLLRNY